MDKRIDEGKRLGSYKKYKRPDHFCQVFVMLINSYLDLHFLDAEDRIWSLGKRTFCQL